MRRAALAYLLCVLLPSAGLSAGALYLLEREIDRRVEEAAGRAGLEAEAAARSLAARLEEAARRAWEGEGLTGRASGGRWIGYAPGAPLDPPDPLEAATPEEARLYRLSMRGGEGFEALGDSARAADAYAFFLPRIGAEPLRLRLRHALGRSLLAGDVHARQLGLAVLREVFAAGWVASAGMGAGARTGAGADAGAGANAGAGTPGEEGIPLDLLAADALRSADPEGWPALREEAAARLRAAAARLSTPLLERLASDLAPGDAALAAEITARRALEAAVAARPEVLGSLDLALLPPDRALLGREEPSGSGVRQLRLAHVDLAPIVAARLRASFELEPAPAIAAGGDARERGLPPGSALRPVRLEGGAGAGGPGPVVAWLRVDDPGFEGRASDLLAWRARARWVVAALLAVPLLGGLALVRYLHKERRLARLRAELLANVSHELKTPVTSIRMFAEMLAEDPLGRADAARFIARLRSESLRLGQLFESLLEVVRLGRREERLELEPVDLEAVLARVAEGFAPQAEKAGVAFRVEGAGRNGPDGREAPETSISSHAGAVERVLWCLLDNALKYRRPEGAEVVLALAPPRPGERFARASVADNGPGIPPGEEERIFEEFYRVRFDDYSVKGAGLGLAIARRLARSLGGDVDVASRPGEGSTFTLRLPREEPAPRGREDAA